MKIGDHVKFTEPHVRRIKGNIPESAVEALRNFRATVTDVAGYSISLKWDHQRAAAASKYQIGDLELAE